MRSRNLVDPDDSPNANGRDVQALKALYSEISHK